jgi:hypothetical protein
MREDVRIARRIARSLIVFAALLVGLVLFLWIAAPGSPGVPMFQPRILGLTYDVAFGIAGLAGMFAGLGWMIRICRADPEPDTRTWRYRDV